MTVTPILARARSQLARHNTAYERQLRAMHSQAVAAILPHVAHVLSMQQGEASLPLNAHVALRHAVMLNMNAFANAAHSLTVHAQHQGVQIGQEQATAQVQRLVPDAMPKQPDHNRIALLIGWTKAKTPLGSLFSGIGEDAAQKVSGVVQRGVSLGQGVKRIFKGVKDALDTALQRALVVVSDQLFSTYRDASMLTAQANSDVLTGWRWICALSPTSCAACVSMHGTVHDLSEELDDHIRGQCEQEFLTADSPDIQSGEDWFDEQEAETQQNILGSNAAYQLYQDGASLSDFLGMSYSEQWGTSIRTRSAKEVAAAR